jgi:hypothetical protein
MTNAELADKDAVEEVDDYDQKALLVNAIAQPLASKKLTKRLLKTVKKGTFEVSHLR